MAHLLRPISESSSAPSQPHQLLSHPEGCSCIDKGSNSSAFSNNLLRLPFEVRDEIYRYVFGPQVICIVRYNDFVKSAKVNGLWKASALLEAEALEVLYRITTFCFHPPTRDCNLTAILDKNVPWSRMQNVKITASLDMLTSPIWKELVERLGACDDRIGTCWLTVQSRDDDQAVILDFLQKAINLSGFKRVVIKVACKPTVWATASSSLAQEDLLPGTTSRIAQEEFADQYNERMRGLLRCFKTALGSPETSYLIEILDESQSWYNMVKVHLQLEFHPKGSLPPGMAPLPAPTNSRPIHITLPRGANETAGV